MTDSKTIKVRAKVGSSVPTPDGKGKIPHDKDTNVPSTRFYLRRVLSGDLIEIDTEIAAKASSKKDS